MSKGALAGFKRIWTVWKSRSASEAFFLTRTWRNWLIAARQTGLCEWQPGDRERRKKDLFFLRRLPCCVNRVCPKTGCIVTPSYWHLRQGPVSFLALEGCRSQG